MAAHNTHRECRQGAELLKWRKYAYVLACCLCISVVCQGLQFCKHQSDASTRLRMLGGHSRGSFGDLRYDLPHRLLYQLRCQLCLQRSCQHVRQRCSQAFRQRSDQLFLHRTLKFLFVFSLFVDLVHIRCKLRPRVSTDQATQVHPLIQHRSADVGHDRFSQPAWLRFVCCVLARRAA